MRRNNSGTRRLHGLGLAITCLATALALAADAGLDAAKSTIVATFRQESVPVDAPFRKFSGQIVYDASKPAAASANLDVETGSLDIGDPAYNAEIRKPAWFDSLRFPLATFRSTAVKAISATQFAACHNLCRAPIASGAFRVPQRHGLFRDSSAVAILLLPGMFFIEFQ